LKTTRTMLSMVLCLALTGWALPVLAQDGGDKGDGSSSGSGGGGFEGWKEGDPPKPAEEPKPAEQPKPVEEPKPAEQPKPAEVGLGANAPGSHESFIPKVDLRYGSVQLMGVFQALMASNVWINDDDATAGIPDIDNTFTFKLQRARIMLKGHVASENLEYFFQGEAVNTLSFALDAYLNYKIKFGDQLLQIRAGRFVPDFSFMMPRNTADLAAINYPVYIGGASGNMGVGGVMALWRQVGLQLTYSPVADLSVMFGAFNGLFADPFVVRPAEAYMQAWDISVNGVTYSSLTDNNKMKDFLLSVNYKLGNASIALSNWFSSPPNQNGDEDNDFIYMGVLGGEWNNNKFHVVGEFACRTIMYADDGRDNIYSFALWGHFGYRLTDLLEVVGRLDWFEPNIEDDTNNDVLRLTAGLHLWLEEKHFRVLTNLFWDMPLENFDDRVVAMGIQVQAAALW